MKEFFLDNFSSPGFPNGKESLIDLIANELLGSEQIPLIERRYYDMLLNFECVSHDAKKYYPEFVGEWNFSEGLCPHRRNLNGLYYQDTSSVPMKITHEIFKNLRFNYIQKNNLDGAVVGLDFPVWFNLNSSKRIMIVAQDPLRNPKWYHESDSAIISSPFGQHSREHRDTGGLRFTCLINMLLEEDYGVYLTDAYKYYIAGWKQKKGEVDLEKGKKIKFPLSQDKTIHGIYRNILSQEIEIINPELIVTMGNAAMRSLKTLLSDEYNNSKILNLTHFSGSAQGKIINSEEYKKIKKTLNLEGKDSIETQAKVYKHAIENRIRI